MVVAIDPGFVRRLLGQPSISVGQPRTSSAGIHPPGGNSRPHVQLKIPFVSDSRLTADPRRDYSVIRLPTGAFFRLSSCPVPGRKQTVISFASTGAERGRG